MIPNSNNSGYLMNIRTVNYILGIDFNWNDRLVTINKYMELDKEFNINNEKVFDPQNNNKPIIGVEDIRLYRSGEDNDLCFIGSSYHQDNIIGIVVGEYDTSVDILESIEIKPSFTSNHCEKNWVVVKYNGSNHIIYKWNPLLICKINYNTKKLDLIEERKNIPNIFKLARGSTCAFNYNNENWFIVHIVSDCDDPRHYYHIFAIFDLNMNLLRYSAPFKFEGEDVEYCLSLIVEDDRVIVPYSIRDNKTKIGVYDKAYIESVIKYTN